MRLKILIFPLSLALSVIILIFLAKPEWDSIQTTKLQLAESQQKLDEVMEKKKNIENLTRIYDQNQDVVSYINSYLPSKREEEDAIHAINYMATGSAVILSNLNLEIDTNKAAPVPPVQDAAAGGAEAQAASAPEIPVLSTVKFKASISGNYEGIRTFLDRASKLEMFNSLDALKIEKNKKSMQSSEGEEIQMPEDLLLLEMDISLGQLKEVEVGNNYFSPLFSESSFNLAAYDKLKSEISQQIPALEAGGEGRTNPFLP